MSSLLILCVVLLLAALAVALQSSGAIQPGGGEVVGTATRTPWLPPESLATSTPSPSPTGGWFSTALPTSAWVSPTPSRTPRGWKTPTPTPP